MTEFQTELKQRCLDLIKASQNNGITGMGWECFVHNVSTHGLGFLDGAPKGANLRWQLNEALKTVYPKTYKGFILD